VAALKPAPFLIDVRPVGVPTQLDQSPLVVRQGDSGWLVLDGERWASPLGDELRGALSSELAALLDTQDINGLPVPSGKSVLSVKVQIRRFDAWPRQRVQLVADWSLGFTNQSGDQHLIRTGSFVEAASGDYPEIVRAEQRATMDLARRIASDARSLMQSRPFEHVTCEPPTCGTLTEGPAPK
jgi:hypothetical protein